MMTKTVTVQDMQQRLTELLTMASNGNTILILKDQIPFAQLTGIGSKPKKRIAGLNRGTIRVSNDFDAPLPDEFWLTGK